MANFNTEAAFDQLFENPPSDQSGTVGPLHPGY